MRLFKRHNIAPAVTIDKVIATYQQPLYWHIRRMVVSHEDAQDVLQETFIKIYKGLATLKDENALKAWVYRIATNESLRHLSHQRETSLSTLDGITQLENVLMESSYVDYDKEMEVKFQRAILALSETQRVVFNLRYYDDLPYQEISAITGSSVESLKVIYHNAKEKVKNFMINN